MKHLLLTTIAAVVLVGCGPSTPDISIHDAALEGNIEVVKQHLAAGTDVNDKGLFGGTPLILAESREIIELLIARRCGCELFAGKWNYAFSSRG